MDARRNAIMDILRMANDQISERVSSKKKKEKEKQPQVISIEIEAIGGAKKKFLDDLRKQLGA